MSPLEYDEGLKKMESEYKAVVEDGRCFVHIRTKRSTDKDLRMLSQLTHYRRFKRVNLQGDGIDSIITNFEYIASPIERAQCTTKEGVESLL